MDLSTPWSGVGRSTLGLYRWLSLLCMFWAVKVSDGESWARAQGAEPVLGVGMHEWVESNLGPGLCSTSAQLMLLNPGMMERWCQVGLSCTSSSVVQALSTMLHRDAIACEGHCPALSFMEVAGKAARA